MTTHYEKIQALGNRMASNLETMGVSASFSDGGLTLADKILQIQHFTDGLLLYADKSIIQIDDTANFYALLLKDGYPQSNEEIKFFVESNSPTLRTLTADTDNIVSPRYSFASMPTFSDSSETVYLDADHSISLRKFGSNQVQLCGAVGTTCHVNVTSISLNNNVLTYTSNGGTTTVDVSDKDMSVIYSDVEGVTINDYYSVYTANTGSNGVATVTYTGVGAGNLNVQAKTINGRLQSEIYAFLDCIKCDVNNSLAVSDYNLRYDTDSLTIAEDGKKFSSTGSSGRRVYLPVNNLTECIIELEAKYSTNGNIGVSGETTSILRYGQFNNTEWLYIRMTHTNGTLTMETSTDGVTWTSKPLSQSSISVIGNIMVTVENGDCYFRNIKIYPI